MSISQSLSNAVSGLNATSRMAEVVSSNLANALTEGYARRVLDTSSASNGGVGAGVRIDGVRRITDPGLTGDRRLADAAVGFQSRGAATLERLEKQFSPPDDPGGLAAKVTALETALVAAGSDPASNKGLSDVLYRLKDVTQSLNANARNVQTMRQEADAAIARDIETLNTSLKQVEQLNADISRTIATGGEPSGLMDQRQGVIDTIASIVPVREVPRSNETVALLTTTGLQLIDGPAAQFEFTHTPTITADMTIASGGLTVLSRDGVPLSTTNGYGKLSGGSLAASFDLRDQTLVSAQSALDGIAVDLISRFENPAVDPTIAAGMAGLLTDAGNALDLTDTVGISRRLDVNAAVDPDQGGDLWRLRDGVGAGAAGPIGDSTQLARWSDGLTLAQVSSPGTPALSAVGQISRVASEFATQRLRSDEGISFANARRDSLYQAELSNGVDTDQELQSLLQIEQAYAANARLVQTVSQMIQSLLEI